MAAEPTVKEHPSPNFGERRDGLKPKLVVLHYTAMSDASAALERLCDPDAEVSAHYLISKSGQIIRMVAEENRAWHAGAGEWHGQTDINSRSIGIELDNTGTEPFSEPLMGALEWLLPNLMARWHIPASGVIGHSDMAPGRKWDPGPKFDWARLARQGLSAHSGAVAPQDHIRPQAFKSLAMAAGYTADVDFDTLLAAVRLRHRPYAQGPLSRGDFASLGQTSDLV